MCRTTWGRRGLGNHRWLRVRSATNHRMRAKTAVGAATMRPKVTRCRNNKKPMTNWALCSLICHYYYYYYYLFSVFLFFNFFSFSFFIFSLFFFFSFIIVHGQKGNFGHFEGKQKGAITPKPEKPRPSKLVCMRLYLHEFFESILFFDPHGLYPSFSFFLFFHFFSVFLFFF